MKSEVNGIRLTVRVLSLKLRVFEIESKVILFYLEFFSLVLVLIGPFIKRVMMMVMEHEGYIRFRLLLDWRNVKENV